MYEKVATYEEMHPIGMEIPKRASLDSFENRSEHYPGFYGAYRNGDLITFPLEESEVRVVTICRTSNVIYRFVVVTKNGEKETYFPIAHLYNERVDANNKKITTSFAKTIAKYESDADIIRALLGHTIKCVYGADYITTSGHSIRMKDFEMVDPPIWYLTDSSTIPDASMEYLNLHKQFGNCGLCEYLARHHEVEEPVQIGFLFDKGFNINDDGLIDAPVAIKDANGRYTVLRETTIGISPLSMLERRLESQYNRAAVGIPGVRKLNTLKRLLNLDKVMIEFKKQPFGESFFRCYPIRLSEASIFDDIGELSFPLRNEVPRIRKITLPDVLRSRKYSLVGTDYHVPYTQTKRLSCILIALNDNPYDNNAIEVRRWFPSELSKFSVSEMSSKTYAGLHDGVYELGFISRQENRDLHDYMMNNDCQLLFGETDSEGKIYVLGGIEQFSVGALKGVAFPFNFLNLEICD